MKKKNISLWLIIGAILALILIGVGLYFVGFLDVYIIFILIPGGLLLSLACFIVSFVSVRRLKKQGVPVPSVKKAALVVSAMIFLCMSVPVVTLILIFAGAIAFM